MTSKEFKCKICIKMYASYKSLWDHNKKFHKNKTIEHLDTVTDNISTVTVITDIKNIVSMQLSNQTISSPIKKNISCKFCNKSFNHRSNKCNHEKICKLRALKPNAYPHKHVINKDNLIIIPTLPTVNIIKQSP